MSDEAPAWARERAEIRPYDPWWSVRALVERDRLRDLLGPWLVDGVEHIGSTAVPGLAAKPIVDLMASVTDLDTVVARAGERLIADGWHYVPPRLDGRPWRRFFVKPDSSGQRREAHLHLLRAGHPRWTEQLTFRDALRRDRDLARRYEELKRRLAGERGDDREAYTEGKAEFVAAVLGTAASAGTWTLGDRTVNRVGFGSMRITANPDREVAIGVLRRAVDLGVNHIDTAAFYRSPGGTLRVGTGPVRYATELIRQALAPYPDELVIVTKVGPGVDPSGAGLCEAVTRAELRGQVEENLRRLGRDHLDVVNLRLMSRPDPDQFLERFGALAALRDAGVIRHLGLSNVRLEDVDAARTVAPVVCVQNSYAIDHRRKDDALVAACRERGIAFVPFFAIAGAGREAGATDDHDAAIRAVAAAHQATPHQVRLAWTLHQGPHVLAIPGTGDVRHLVENIAAGALRLSPEELALLG